MNTGEHVWMAPIGDTPDNIKNHERLKGVTIPRTGRGGRNGIMLTKTLLWSGERGPLVTVNGQQGSWFRLYDKATGEIVLEILLPANVTAAPMTYMVNRQAGHLVAVGAAGAGGVDGVGAALKRHAACEKRKRAGASRPFLFWAGGSLPTGDYAAFLRRRFCWARRYAS